MRVRAAVLMLIGFLAFQPKILAQFQEHEVWSSIENPFEVEVIDIDGDGDNDVVSASYGAGVTIFENVNGRGLFTPYVLGGTGSTHLTSLSITDIGDDGDLDIMATGESGEAVFLYEQTSLFSFTEHEVSTSSTRGQDIKSGDLDGDEAVDIVVAVSGLFSDFDGLLWYQNDGDENFTIDTLVAFPFASNLTIVDLDEDGDNDIVSISKHYSTSELRWFENDGTQSFTGHLLDSGFEYGADVHVVDLDEDGNLDIVAVDSENIVWHKNDGTQSFTTQTLANSSSQFNSIDLLDYDNDGDLDMLAADRLADKVSLFINDGAETFTETEVSSHLDAAQSAKFGDINGDGSVDIVASAYAGNKINWIQQKEEIPGFANFEKNAISTTTSSLSKIIPVDLNLDGNIDAVSTYETDNRVYWHEGDGNGGFTTAQPFSNAVSSPDDVIAVDIDNDSDIDIIVPSQSQSDVDWYENDGSLNFTKTTIASSISGVSQIEATDLDADLDLDLIVSSQNSEEIFWLENDGSGSFTKNTISPGGLFPSAKRKAAATFIYVTTSDVDNDGDMDVIAAFREEDAVVWFENSGAGNFTEHIINLTGNEPTSIEVQDVDKDGYKDIITTSKGSNQVVWLQNDGTNQFTENILPASVNWPSDVKSVDLDDDGDWDIIASSEYGYVKIFENDGTANFSNNYTAIDDENDIRSIALADIDNDGDVDIFSADSGEKIAWYKNTAYGELVTIGGDAGANWRLISVPVENAKLSDLAEFIDIQGFSGGDFPSADKNVFLYDDTGVWENPSGISTNLTPGYGLAVYTFDHLEDTLNFRKAEPKGDVVVPLNKIVSEEGLTYYTLVGNPFYSNYDLTNLETDAGDINDNVHFWDTEVESYRVKDRNGYIISPHQGFWVSTTKDRGSPTEVTFPVSGKTESDTTGSWLRKEALNQQGDLEFVLQSESGYYDTALRLSTRKYASIDWDRADAGKLPSLKEKFVAGAFIKKERTEFIKKAVESIPFDLSEEYSIPLHVWAEGVSGVSSLSWSGTQAMPEEWSFILYDTQTGASADLRGQNRMVFELGEHFDEESPRFELVINPNKTVSVDENQTPHEVSLVQNYPNPFNPSTTIGYQLPVAGNIEIKVYDLVGKEVAVLVDGHKKAGRYQVRFNAENLASGIYIYQLKTANTIITKKLTLIK